MVSDRNRQIIERRRSGESFSAIGTALGISRERVRQIVEREERREQRAQELEEAARLSQQPNPLQLPPRLRNMLAKLFGTPDFTLDDVAALEYSVAMFSTIPGLWRAVISAIPFLHYCHPMTACMLDNSSLRLIAAV